MDAIKNTILIVDDEEINLNLYKESLKDEGYEILTAKDGVEALDIAVSREPDCIVSDIVMPRMTGLELTKILKTNPVTAFIPIILVTGLTDFEDVIRGLSTGADDYLTKPVNILELQTRIRGALKTRELQKSLRSANRTISTLTSYSTRLVAQFNPMSFNYDAYIQYIMEIFLSQPNDSIKNRPWGILNGHLKNGEISGEIIFRGENDLLESRYLNIPQDTFVDKSIEVRSVFFKNSCNNTYLYIPDKNKKRRVDINNFAYIRTEDEIIILINFGYQITQYDVEILNHLFLLCEFFNKLSYQVKDTEHAFRYAIEALSRAAEANDEDTGNHIIRVNEYSKAIAREMRLSDKFIEEIAFQAQMHDVGKIHIHPDILRKNGPLTKEEFREIMKHPESGAKILGDEIRLKMAKNIALTHHERADGSGYPRGLKGNEIPIEGKIVSIADIYDALRNPRSYKPAFTHEETIEIITKGDGRTLPSHFDSAILTAFIRTEKQLEEIYKRLK